MELFALHCPTCQTRLKVRDRAAIGQILACPRCSSMVQVIPPEGWELEQDASSTVAPPLNTPSSQHRDAAATSVAQASDEFSEVDDTDRRSTLWIISGLSLVMLLVVGGLLAALWKLQTGSTGDDPANALAHSSTSSVTAEPPAAAEDETSEDDNLDNQPSESDPAVAEISVPDTTEVKPPATDSTTVDDEDITPDNTVTSEELAETPFPPEMELGQGKDLAEDKTLTGIATIDLKAEEEKNQPEVERISPREIDVAARLEDSVLSIHYTRIPLGQFINVLSRLSTIPMSFDPVALEELNLNLATEISVQYQEASVSTILSGVLTAQKLGYRIVDNQILITHPAAESVDFRQIQYDISDLANSAAEMQQILVLVERFISPESWKSNGGEGELKTTARHLIVRNSDSVHWQTLAFCEKLRLARGRPLRSQHSIERFPLASRYARSQQVLSQQLTLNYFNPTPLHEIIRFLESQAQVQIFIDQPALAAVGLSTNSTTHGVLERSSLEASLHFFVDPLQLTLRRINHRTLQITTPEALAKTQELEIYSIRKIISPETSGQDIALRLQQRIAADSWRNQHGSGDIYFDQDSGCLLVLQSQFHQIEIEKLLNSWQLTSELSWAEELQQPAA